ncbi:MAG: VacJ family lipoprotein [Sphingobium sp.]
MSASTLAIAMILGGTPVSPIDTPVATPVAKDAAVPPTGGALAAADMAAAPSLLAPEAPGREAGLTGGAVTDTSDENITVVARGHHAPGDPLQGANQASFAVTQAVDKALVGPVAHVYERVVPKPARNGLRNFFRNLHEPVVFVNFLLQLKPGKAFETLGRFAINSTIGAGGLVDVARTRTFKLPYRPNGFANSLAYYGVKPGPFLYLPIIGATTLRDLFGRGMDTAIYPLPGGRPISGEVYAASSTTVKALNRRVDFDGTLHEMRDGDRQAYASMREYYLARRAAEVAALHSHGRGHKADAPVELTGPVTVPAPPIP